MFSCCGQGENLYWKKNYKLRKTKTNNYFTTFKWNKALVHFCQGWEAKCIQFLSI